MAPESWNSQRPERFDDIAIIISAWGGNSEMVNAIYVRSHYHLITLSARASKAMD
jgi:hypothetical protein